MFLARGSTCEIRPRLRGYANEFKTDARRKLFELTVRRDSRTPYVSVSDQEES